MKKSKKNEKCMEENFEVKSNLPDADSHDGNYYQQTTRSGNTFTFKKFTVLRPHGWQQVTNSDYSSDGSGKAVEKK